MPLKFIFSLLRPKAHFKEFCHMMFLSQQKRKEPCVAGTGGLGFVSFFFFFALGQFYSALLFLFLPCILIRIHLGFDILLVSLTVLVFLVQCNTKQQLRSG